MHRDDLKLIEYPEVSHGESFIQTTKSFVDIFGSLIPIIGPAIGKSIEYTLQSMQEKRLSEFAYAIRESLIDIPEHIYKSEEFAEAIKKGISRYVNEGNKDKRQLLINMNKSLLKLLPSDKSNVFDLYLIFDELFGHLSLPSLQALMHIEDRFKVKAEKHSIIKFLLESQEIHGRRCFSELLGQGLLEEEEEYRTFSFDPKPQKIVDDQARVYRISPLGGVFLAWLRYRLKTEEDFCGMPPDTK